MLEAHSGRGNYPKIRTFNKWDTSTNSVFDDLKEAEIWTGFEERVDINDLTWEQRERVLRLLFAKLNGHKSKQRYREYLKAQVTSLQKITSIATF